MTERDGFRERLDERLHEVFASRVPSALGEIRLSDVLDVIGEAARLHEEETKALREDLALQVRRLGEQAAERIAERERVAKLEEALREVEQIRQWADPADAANAALSIAREALK